jgi:spoIIIJ-associated protein
VNDERDVAESTGSEEPTTEDQTVAVADDGSADSPAEPGAEVSARVQRLEEEGEVAADYLEELLDIADLDGDIDIDIDKARASVSIVSEEDGDRYLSRLVGEKGEVLDAIQELTRLAVQARLGERSRIMVDIAGHRADRKATLTALAEEAIGTVRSTGSDVSLDPMNPVERKVVHDVVAEAGLSSDSEGVEPKRYVVIRAS